MSDINSQRLRSERIKDFFILDEGGYSIYHRAYTNSKVDRNLISGFISAIFSFSKEMSIERIRVMDMQESRFIYEYRAPFIFVLNVIKDEVDIMLGTVILNRAMDFFEAFYNEERVEKHALVTRLHEIKFDEKIDGFIDDALLQDFVRTPPKMLYEVENYLVGLFGSVGNDLIDIAVEKVCKHRADFTTDHLGDVASAIEESLNRKISPKQAKEITDQIRHIFEK